MCHTCRDAEQAKAAAQSRLGQVPRGWFNVSVTLANRDVKLTVVQSRVTLT